MSEPNLSLSTPSSNVLPVVKLEDARAYAKSITDRIMSFSGKPGHNPYLWLSKTGLDKLNAALATEVDDSNQGLLRQVMSVQYSDPKVESTYI